jgi:23S rRNA (uracil1939-C5)-methyltransferase/tRNA (uracil-5-)-methyltransferase
MQDPPKGFIGHPYPYHQELELVIESVTNLGFGIARDDGWVIQVPFTLPGETIKAKIYRNHKNYSDADCVEILDPSSDRVEAECELFGVCGGCQYQAVRYETQLEWKRKQVKDSFDRIGGIDLEVEPVEPSPKTYGYRSKLTPHYERARASERRKVGFLRHGSRKVLIDVPQCPIATEAINNSLPAAREEIHLIQGKKKGGTLLLRDTPEGVVTDPKKTASERVGNLLFQFRAGEFFQNNPFILPKMVEHVIGQAKEKNPELLVDAYCGGGLFSLSAAEYFERVVGIEISREGFEWARSNALLNKIDNAEFLLGDASTIFEELQNCKQRCSLIIDPPRRGCDEDFLNQTLEFRPERIIYVSCDPATQARDVQKLIEGEYQILQSKPFDLFPQTRHIENVVTLELNSPSDP